MPWQDQCSDDYSAYQSAPPHEASVTHELLGGAVAYEAAKAYEQHKAANGQPATHARAKEILAGITGAIVDREVETRGLDFIDRERAKREASRRAEAGLASCGDYPDSY